MDPWVWWFTDPPVAIKPPSVTVPSPRKLPAVGGNPPIQYWKYDDYKRVVNQVMDNAVYLTEQKIRATDVGSDPSVHLSLRLKETEQSYCSAISQSVATHMFKANTKDMAVRAINQFLESKAGVWPRRIEVTIFVMNPDVGLAPVITEKGIFELDRDYNLSAKAMELWGKQFENASLEQREALKAGPELPKLLKEVLHKNTTRDWYVTHPPLLSFPTFPLQPRRGQFTTLPAVKGREAIKTLDPMSYREILKNQVTVVLYLLQQAMQHGEVTPANFVLPQDSVCVDTIIKYTPIDTDVVAQETKCTEPGHAPIDINKYVRRLFEKAEFCVRPMWPLYMQTTVTYNRGAANVLKTFTREHTLATPFMQPKIARMEWSRQFMAADQAQKEQTFRDMTLDDLSKIHAHFPGAMKILNQAQQEARARMGLPPMDPLKYSEIANFVSAVLSGVLKLQPCDPSSMRVELVMPPDKERSLSPTYVIFAKAQGHNIVLKMWMHVEKSDWELEELGLRQQRMLDKEVTIYKKITNELVVTERAPNFIAYLGHALCTAEQLAQYSDVVNTLRAVALEDLGDKSRRKELMDLLGHAKISVLVTETPCAAGDYVRGGCVAYDDWMSSFLLDHEQFYSVFFSLVYSLCALHSIKIVHRDLHPGNILVRRYPIDDNYAVIYVHPTDRNKYYVLLGKDLTARPFIFDWDNAIMVEGEGGAPLKISITNDRMTLLDNTVIDLQTAQDPETRKLAAPLRNLLYVIRAKSDQMFDILETHGFFDRFKPTDANKEALSRLSADQVDIFGPDEAARMAAATWHDDLRRASKKRKWVEEDDETESDIEPL